MTKNTITVRAIRERRLALAVERLGATRISPRRWEYYAHETQRYYVCSTRDLADLGDMIARGVADAYSHWCAGSTAREVVS